VAGITRGKRHNKTSRQTPRDEERYVILLGATRDNEKKGKGKREGKHGDGAVQETGAGAGVVFGCQ